MHCKSKCAWADSKHRLRSFTRMLRVVRAPYHLVKIDSRNLRVGVAYLRLASKYIASSDFNMFVISIYTYPYDKICQRSTLYRAIFAFVSRSPSHKW